MRLVVIGIYDVGGVLLSLRCCFATEIGLRRCVECARLSITYRLRVAYSRPSRSCRALPTGVQAAPSPRLSQLLLPALDHRARAPRRRYLCVSAFALLALTTSRFPGAPTRRCRIRLQRPSDQYSVGQYGSWVSRSGVYTLYTRVFCVFTIEIACMPQNVVRVRPKQAPNHT